MRALRVPRSGSTIFGMLIALVATMLLPFVFMAALAQSAESRPRPLHETIVEVGAPIVRALDRAFDRSVRFVRSRL